MLKESHGIRIDNACQPNNIHYVVNFVNQLAVVWLFCPPPVVILLVSWQWRVFSMSSTTSFRRNLGRQRLKNSKYLFCHFVCHFLSCFCHCNFVCHFVCHFLSFVLLFQFCLSLCLSVFCHLSFGLSFCLSFFCHFSVILQSMFDIFAFF